MCNDQSNIINHYKYVVEHYSGYMYLKDLESRYIAVSNKLAIDCGLADMVEKMIGKTDSDLGWEDMAGQFRTDDLAVISTKESQVSKYLMPLFNDIGTYMMIKTEKTPVLDQDDNVIAILGVSTDISPDLTVLFDTLGHRLYPDNKDSGLSKLESKIIILLTLGKAPREIQQYLYANGVTINIETLVYIKNQLFKKLGIVSISELIKFYSSIGIDDVSNIIIKKMITK